MGLLRTIKKMLLFGKAAKLCLREAREKETRYLAMSGEDLFALSDEELFAAVLARMEHKVGQFGEWENGVNALNASEKLVYSVNWLEMEVNNGGLCQFFVNSSRMVAPYISEYLGVIGAQAHKTLFDTFIATHHIDLSDLTSFIIDDIGDYDKQTERYPFDEYDEAFYALESLEPYLQKFVREHIEDF